MRKKELAVLLEGCAKQISQIGAKDGGSVSMEEARTMVAMEFRRGRERLLREILERVLGKTVVTDEDAIAAGLPTNSVALALMV